ncbi:sensory transduction histidine kinase [hydrocarbon metagenome]|uniref:histidine kinase n=1 Tax=hydrocarbon metagenome TaxID=938273 RepID=A0A0W8ESF4_9ZZZZ
MITVLFVDDEPMLLELSKRYLETTGKFRVDTATSAQAALGKLEVSPYDAVVSDYQLPGMDGITFLTVLRSRYPDLPFLFFTGRGREEVVIGAFEKGADCFVQKGGAPKPQFTELMHKIEQAVRHRAAERELRESEQRYHAFFATTKDSVFITSDDSRWIDFNDAAIQLFGYDTRDELAAMHISDLYLVPEERQVHLDYIRGHGHSREYPVRLRRKDGTPIIALVSTVSVTDPAGGTIYYGTVRDITEKSRQDSLIRENEELFRNIVEDQTEFVCRFLPDGTHVFVNEAYCRYFGKTRDEITGHRFIPAIHPEDREQLRDHLAGLTPENPVASIEHRIIMPDGSIRWQHWSDRAIMDDQGRVREYQSVGRDITEKKETDRALRQAHQKLNMLSSITRHDIMNKLLTLRGYTRLIQEEAQDLEIRTYADAIDHAARAIDEQLQFTRDYQDLGMQAPAWIRVADILDQVKGQLELGRIRLETGLDGVMVCADPLFSRAWYNLIDNTLRHAPQATGIRVTAEEAGDTLLLVYEDDGPGIPADQKERIFDRGFGKNTGLGLFIVREILAITGMTIRENGVVGSGARFEITVPGGMYRKDAGKS